MPGRLPLLRAFMRPHRGGGWGVGIIRRHHGLQSMFAWLRDDGGFRLQAGKVATQAMRFHK